MCRLARSLIGCSALLCLAGVNAAAQPSSSKAFEVASIKLTPPPPDGGATPSHFRQSEGGIDYSGASLYDLVRRAYSVQPYQLPESDHLPRTRWDIVAKLPPDATPADIPVLLQNLLASRFELKVHWAEREIQAFALVAVKSGARLTQVEGLPGPLGGSRAPSGATRLRGRTNLALLAQVLSISLRVPVVDMTGMSGVFEIAFEYMPETPATDSGGVPVAEAGSAASLMSDAMEQSLGLKLERRKIRVQTLVIDSFRKTPTEN